MEQYVQKYLTYIEPNTTAVGRVTWLLKDHFSKSDEIPRSQLVYFFDELSKIIINWIGKGEDERLKRFSNELERVLQSDAELNFPVQTLSKKQKFGANLAFIQDMINIYLDNDLEIKDYQHILMSGKVEDRLRRVLTTFYEKARPLNSFNLYEEVYSTMNEETSSITEEIRKLIQRDINRLIEYKLIRRIQLNSRRHLYELTPRAHHLKDEITRRQSQEEVMPLNYQETMTPIAATLPAPFIPAYSPSFSELEITT